MCMTGRKEDDNRCSFERLLHHSDDKAREYCEAIGTAIAISKSLRKTKLTKAQIADLERLEAVLNKPFNR